MGMGSMVMRGKCRGSRLNRSRSMRSKVKYNMICNYKCIIYYIGFLLFICYIIGLVIVIRCISNIYISIVFRCISNIHIYLLLLDAYLIYKYLLLSDASLIYFYIIVHL